MGRNSLAADRVRQTELGEEKFCPRCVEWWPADGEFFWVTKGVLFYCCKACYSAMDRRKGRDPKVPTDVPLVPQALRLLPFMPGDAP